MTRIYSRGLSPAGTSTAGLVLPVVSKTGNYTSTIADYLILCDASSGVFTITLPASAGVKGRQYTIKKTDSSQNSIAIDGNAAETIDGQATKSLNLQYESITIQSDGSNWFII